MKTEGFNLSEKEDIIDMTYDREDVKEFIKLFKKEMKNHPRYIISYYDILKTIDGLAGNKLVEKK